MSMWDNILPHRLRINKALRTASDELHAHIDAHQIEHNRAIERYHAEIEAAKTTKDRQFDTLKEQYLSELSKDNVALTDLQSLIFEYVDKYLTRKYLYTRKEKISLETQLLEEHSAFLTHHIDLIKEEIEILEKRKDTLSFHAKTDDIIELINLTGCNLPCEESDTPKTLLEKVNTAQNSCTDQPRVTKSALLRLRTLLQERTEYLPLIEYITLLIQQKEYIRRNLSKERCKTNAAKNEKKNEKTALQEQLTTFNRELSAHAIRLRDIWAAPNADISVKLTSIKTNLDLKYGQLNSVKAEISHMKETHSNDNSKWNRLQDEKGSIEAQIGSLKSQRESLNNQRNQLTNQRKLVSDLLKKSHISLYPQKRSIDSDPDEVRILKQKRTHLCEEIDIKSLEYDRERAAIKVQFDHQRALITTNINTAEKRASEKKASLEKAQRQVKTCQDNDDRFFLAKIFSESANVTNAKNFLANAEREFEQAKQNLLAFQKNLQVCNQGYERQLSDLEKKLNYEKSELERRIADIDCAITFIRDRKKRRGGSSFGCEI